MLFKRPPDVVHEHLVRLGGRVSLVPPLSGLLHGVWAYSNPRRLRQSCLGLDFPNPVGLSAGFDKNFELVRLMKAVGFGFMEGGSLTYETCAGNPRPWFHRLPKSKSLVVHAGLANQGVKRNVARIAQYPPSLFAGFPLNISVAKTNSAEASSEADAIADYIGSLRHIKQSGLGQIITLNISCPNTFGGEPFTTPERLERLLAKVDTVAMPQPIFIKMPIDLAWDDFSALLAVAARHGVAGVTIGNLAKSRARVHPADSLPPATKGNLSGKPTWELCNNLIRQTYREYSERFIIIGVGGIFSAEDAYTKIKLGATLVELITGLIFEGPQLIGQVNRGLVDLLVRDGYSNIAEAIGVDAQKEPTRP